MSVTTLEEKFVLGLGGIYDAEYRFSDALVEMLDQATSHLVKSLLQQQMSEAKQQISNLEQVYEILSQIAEREKSDGAAGMVKEGQKLIEAAVDSPALLELAIANAALKMKYYEIASYRGMLAEAQLMNQNEIAQLLQQNLQQEEQMAQKIEHDMHILVQQSQSRAALA